MTEREKQLAGLPYDGADQELKTLQYRAQNLVKAFNALPMQEEECRRVIAGKLFGKAGKNLRIYPPIHVDFGCNIYTGDDVFINQNCTFLDNNRITIGNRVLIRPDVRIYAWVHPLEGSGRFRAANGKDASIVSSSKPVTIGDDVWIGGGAVILPGLSIGSNSVIGAGSVVTKDVPGNVVVAGNPARIIKTLKGGLENE